VLYLVGLNNNTWKYKKASHSSCTPCIKVLNHWDMQLEAAEIWNKIAKYDHGNRNREKGWNKIEKDGH